MESYQARRKRSRGGVERLPSGALRVVVYAGKDPLTGRRHYLREVVPAGPKASTEADRVMRRLAAQVDERRHPRTNATLDQLLDRYLETLDVGRTTHRMYGKYLEKHVRPFVGRLKAGAVDAEVLDSLYAELRRCRTHCTGSGGLDHRTLREHACDGRCRSHACRPLSSTTIRHIHFVLRGAYEKGVRWRWVGTNPVLSVSAPAPRKPEPRPPSAEEAARLVDHAWERVESPRPWTTRRSSRSGRPCSANCSTPGTGTHPPSCPRRSSSGSKPGTTRDADTPASVTSPQPTTNDFTPPPLPRHDQHTIRVRRTG